MPALNTPRIVRVTTNVTDRAESISLYRATFNAAFNEDISSFIFGDPASPTVWVHLGKPPGRGCLVVCLRVSLAWPWTATGSKATGVAAGEHGAEPVQ